MEIKLEGNWIITSDSMNYKLSKYEYKEDKKGINKMFLSNTTYHGSIKSTLLAYKEKYVKDSDCQTIGEIISLIKELDIYIRNILEGI